MAQFDVYRLKAAGKIQQVISLQGDYYDGLATLLVIPLLALDDTQPIAGINLAVAIDGQEFVVKTDLIATLPKDLLGPKIASLTKYEYEIKNTLDRLIAGY